MNEFRDANVICLSETWLNDKYPNPPFLGLTLCDGTDQPLLPASQGEMVFLNT